MLAEQGAEMRQDSQCASASARILTGDCAADERQAQGSDYFRKSSVQSSGAPSFFGGGGNCEM
jgi:hypothetical protein